MSTFKEIETKDSKGRYHGYQEWYWYSGKLWFRGMYHHNQQIGYIEIHDTKRTKFYIK